MNGELSHGLLRLITQGNRILRMGSNDAVLLRGVNRSGLEYSEPGAAGFLASAAFSQAEMQEIVQGWGSKVVRVQFNQDWALHGRGEHSATEYMQALDQIIDWAAAFGAYTLLDLQWLDADTVYGRLDDEAKSPNHEAPLPNALTLDLWAGLAERYREEPAVLFDVFNEPHNPLSDDFLPIFLIDASGTPVESDVDFVSAEEWLPWARRLVAVIRRIHPDSLIFVGGIDWAFDLSRIRLDAPNIAYSTHVYPNRPQHQWPDAFGHSASEVPVFVGEWVARIKIWIGGSSSRFSCARPRW
jgi:endoglucanase